MLSQVVANQVGQQRVVHQDVADTSRIRKFLRMNPLKFTGSNVTKDPENYVEEKSLQEKMSWMGRLERLILHCSPASKAGKGK